MASKEIIERIKEITGRQGRIMATEVLPAINRDEDVTAETSLMVALEIELRRACMEGDCPTIILQSTAGPDDDAYNAGNYYLVTARSNEECSDVVAWRALDDFGVELEFRDGGRAVLSEWDTEAELVYLDDPGCRPSCD